MNSLNSVFLLGNLARDPSVHFTPLGSLVCEFKLAVTSRRLEECEARDAADFIPVEAWMKLGRACHDHLHQGSLVHVEGYLKAKTWIDRKTRERRSRLVVIASDVRFLGRLRPSPPDRASMPDRYRPASATPVRRGEGGAR